MSEVSAGPSVNERDGDVFGVRVKVTRGQAETLLRRGGLDFGDRPNIRENPDGTSSLNLFVTRADIETFRAEGYEIEVGANLSARARDRLAEVGQGDRFDGGRIPPQGIGRKIVGRGEGDAAHGGHKPDDRPERAP